MQAGGSERGRLRRVLRLLQWMCPPKGSNGEQGPDGAKSAKAFFTLTLPSLVRPTRREPLGRTRGSRRGAWSPFESLGTTLSKAEGSRGRSWGSRSISSGRRGFQPIPPPNMLPPKRVLDPARRPVRHSRRRSRKPSPLGIASCRLRFAVPQSSLCVLGALCG